MPDRILVFIPCYNCASQIGRVLKQFTPEIGRRFEEILVLDNGSKDGTVESAMAAGAVNTSIKKLTIGRNRENYNLGGSHKVAFAYALANKYSHVVVLHGDDQGDINDLLPILDQGLHNKFDACLGSRFMPASKLIGYSTFRIFGNHVFNVLFSIGSLSKVMDLGSGLNIFAESLFSSTHITKFSDDLRFNIYLLLYAIDQKHKLRYFPISWREDDQISNVKMTSQALKTLAILQDYIVRRPFFRSHDHRSKAYSDYGFEVLAQYGNGNSL